MVEKVDSQIKFKPVPSKGGIYSWIFCILIGGMFIALSISLSNEDGILYFHFISLFTISLFVYILYGYYSMCFILTEDSIVIKWAFSKKTIPYETISSVGITNGELKEGIRSAGIGIPGYLVGAFKLLLDGELSSVKLYATKIDHLIILKSQMGKKLKFFGLTPDKHDELLSELKIRCENASFDIIDTTQEIQQDENITNKNYKIMKILYFISMSIIIITLISFIFYYNILPDTNVPLHWGADGQVDRWGQKSSLIPIFIFLLSFGLALTLIFYYLICKKGEIGKTKYGPYLMILPLIINMVFLIIALSIFITTENTL